MSVIQHGAPFVEGKKKASRLVDHDASEGRQSSLCRLMKWYPILAPLSEVGEKFRALIRPDPVVGNGDLEGNIERFRMAFFRGHMICHHVRDHIDQMADAILEAFFREGDIFRGNGLSQFAGSNGESVAAFQVFPFHGSQSFLGDALVFAMIEERSGLAH